MDQGLPGFEEFRFRERRVFTAGSGTRVILMHELPGMSPRCLALARILANESFKVYVPLLFGQPGVKSLFNMVRVCISSEFRLLAAARKSPITDWLRALCAEVATNRHNKIGVIGMCLTGGYVLSLMADEHVYAPVMSQPALPLPITCSRRRALGISDEELRSAKARHIPILALRFEGDWICPPERLDRLCAEFREYATIITVPSPAQKPRAHSILTEELAPPDDPSAPTRKALNSVLTFLRNELDVKPDHTCDAQNKQ